MRFAPSAAAFLALLVIALPQARAETQAFPASLDTAQARTVPVSKAQMLMSFAPVVESASPAVVMVWGASEPERPSSPYWEQFARRMANEGGAPRPAGVMRSLASGVIVDPAGLVVTNHHVVEGLTAIKVSLADEREFEAEVVVRDRRTDLAVLRLKEAQDLPALTLADSDTLRVGDLVLAIGNPFGLGHTVTEGIVSGLARTQVEVTDHQFFIQTDAAINPGNSGGALVDMAGRLVGINTVILSPTGGSHGVGFATPATMVELVLAAARRGLPSIERPWLGARLQVLRPEGEAAGRRPSGAFVARVFETGPAAQAGLLRGDVILEVGGRTVKDPESFNYHFMRLGTGGSATVTVLRDRERLALSVPLAPAPETREREPVAYASPSPLAGATGANMSPAVADELSIPILPQGVVLTDVPERSTAHQNRLRRGDVVLAAGDVEVTGSAQLGRLMASLPADKQAITIFRDRRVVTLELGGPQKQAGPVKAAERRRASSR